jgi:protein O-GlcNAc transferase
VKKPPPAGSQQFSADQALQQAIQLQMQGKLDQAAVQYQEILKLWPSHFDAKHLLGIIRAQQGRNLEALELTGAAVKTNPHDAPASSNLGIVFQRLGRSESALASFDRALAMQPGHVDALFNRGLALIALGQLEDALASFDKALAIQPNYLDAINNRGLVLVALGRPEEAVASFDRALAIKPDYVEALNNVGVVLSALKRPERALASFGKAVTINPDYVEAWLNRGNTFFDCNLNNEARESCQRALSIDRKSWPARYRDLQGLSGELTCRIIGQAFPEASLAPPPAPDEPIRVGFVSSFLYLHSNWKIPLKGWMGQLDRKRFKIFGYHVGQTRDAETDIAASMCDRFVHRSLSLEGWRHEILHDAPHVLIYPGLLMDEVSHQLAAQRLAAVQCNSWGHPETSGMPTLDYFLSSDLMEPPDAAEHYTERLIRLPNLSVFYAPTETAPVSIPREELNLRSDATVFWCGQTLSKYLPQYDHVFAEITKLVGNCQFVFLSHTKMQRITELFRNRLDAAFAQLGLKASDHIVIFDTLSPSRFVGAINQCDIVLDSIGWSGCNSTMESLAGISPSSPRRVRSCVAAIARLFSR